jgi:hypothetical protein
MQVTVLYFDDCPNWKVARQRLHEALAAGGLADEVDVSYQTVQTAEEAERVGFRGSPTILVDGRDPWADNGATGGLSCRIYRTEHGPDGAPSVAQLAEALAG